MNFRNLLSLILLFSIKLTASHIEVNSLPTSTDTSFTVTWDVDTVFITRSLIVDQNQHCNLTIRPGTVVLFTGPYNIAFHSFTSSFNATGTHEKPIVFSTVDSTRWNGLSFTFYLINKTPHRVINILYCSFEKCGRNAIEFNGTDTITSVFINNSSFDNNKTNSSMITFHTSGNQKPFVKTLISQNSFYNNDCAISGAINMLNDNYKDKKTNVIIEGNAFLKCKGKMCGAIIIESEQVLIRDNLFEYNGAVNGSGAIDLRLSPSIIENNFIYNNWCTIDYDNPARPGTTGGGAIHVMFGDPNDFKQPCVIVGNKILFNSAPNGGAIHCNASRVLLVNNTICNNISTFGGAVYCESITTYVRFYNTILWGNRNISGKNDQCFNWKSYPDFYNCCIEGGTADFIQDTTVLGQKVYQGKFLNCSSSFPQFTDTVNSEFRLSRGSPCIDAGYPDTSGLYLPTLECGGYPRISNNIIDIGCYESNYMTNVQTRNRYYYSGNSNLKKVVILEKNSTGHLDRPYWFFSMNGKKISHCQSAMLSSGFYCLKKESDLNTIRH